MDYRERWKLWVCLNSCICPRIFDSRSKKFDEWIVHPACIQAEGYSIWYSLYGKLQVLKTAHFKLWETIRLWTQGHCPFTKRTSPFSSLHKSPDPCPRVVEAFVFPGNSHTSTSGLMSIKSLHKSPDPGPRVVEAFVVPGNSHTSKSGLMNFCFYNHFSLSVFSLN